MEFRQRQRQTEKWSFLQSLIFHGEEDYAQCSKDSPLRSLGFAKILRISYHCWTESLVDLKEGQLILHSIIMFQMGNKHVNMKDDYMALVQRFFADRR